MQVKTKRKLKSIDKDNGPASPTMPGVTHDPVFDSGRELSSDVYSSVGTGTQTGKNKNPSRLLRLQIQEQLL